jgi:tetratricopeptide (TPR) repeat protein
MRRKLSFLPEEEPEDLIRRYEAFLSQKTSAGYFDVYEMEQIVDYYLRWGRTRESTVALELGFRLHPGSPVLLVQKAKILLASGQPQKALFLLNNGVNTNEYDVILVKISVLAALERYDEANALAGEILAGQSQETDAACLDIAYIYLSNFDIENALFFLNKGEAANPQNIDILHELAFCHNAKEDNEAAIAVYQRILKLDPYSAETWFDLGQIYFLQTEYSKAIMAYEYASVIRPEDSLTFFQKAHSHFQLQQYREAIEDYLIFMSMTPDSWQTWLFVGECYERMEQFDNAIQYYSKSLKMHDDNYEALTGIAICLMEQEKFEDSLAFSQRAIDIAPEAADGWVYLAEGLVGLDRPEEALQAYIKSIRLDPNQPETYMAIANICMDKGEFNLALEYYRQALALNNESDLQNIHLFMAVAYYKTGRREEAFFALDKAMEESLEAYKIFHEICPESDF